MKANDLANAAARILEDKKAENVEIFDLRERGYFTDFVVIATAFVGRHSFALLDELKTTLKPQGAEFLNVDEESEDWIVADLGEVVVHIFTENTRKKFNLEDFLRNFKNPQISE